MNAYNWMYSNNRTVKEFGRCKEHKLTFEITNNDYAPIRYEWAYYHYGQPIGRVLIYPNGNKSIHILRRCFSTSDKDNFNGLLKCLDINDVKAHTQYGLAYLTIPNDDKFHFYIIYDTDKNKWNEI